MVDDGRLFEQGIHGLPFQQMEKRDILPSLHIIKTGIPSASWLMLAQTEASPALSSILNSTPASMARNSQAPAFPIQLPRHTNPHRTRDWGPERTALQGLGFRP